VEFTLTQIMSWVALKMKFLL